MGLAFLPIFSGSLVWDVVGFSSGLRELVDVGFVHISGYEVVECLFFFSSFFFFLGAGLWQNKTKGPK